MLKGKVKMKISCSEWVWWINSTILGAPDNYCHCIILSSKVCAETNALKHDRTHLLGVHNRLNVFENKESFQQCTWGDTQVWGGKNQFSLE